MNQIYLSEEDSLFLKYLRGISIFIIVFGHMGGFWMFSPYSEYLHAFVPVFFFISGAASYYSFTRAKSTLEYYKKRVVGFLIPYYLYCLLLLLIYIVSNGIMPAFSFHNLANWLFIAPPKNVLPFSYDQVWFIHTLFIIMIISPVYFYYLKNRLFLSGATIIMLTISFVQIMYDIDDNFIIGGHNLFKPIILSIFFIYGSVYVTSLEKINRFNLPVIMTSFIIICVLLVKLGNLKLSFARHTYAPDIYFVIGSFAAIAFILLSRDKLMVLGQKFKLLKTALIFMWKHTYAIFLLHFIVEYWAMRVFSFMIPDEHNYVYAIIKLVLVLTFTCLLAVPFSYVAANVQKKILRLFVITQYKTQS